MTETAGLLLALTGVFAVVDWVAVGTRRRSLELVFKPLTLMALIGVAVTLEPNDSTVRAWFVAGLVFSLGGDVFLMWADRLFVAGLASFLVGHVCYVIGFWVGDLEAAGLALGAVVVVVSLATLGRRILRAVHDSDQPGLIGPVAAYVGVISAMVLSAFGTANPWAIAGSGLFYASDAMIAWTRFIGDFGGARVAIIVTYHLGQVGLVLYLVT